MRFLPWWRGRRTDGPAGNRLARFRKVLEAALTVPLYEASLRSARIDGMKALNRVSDIESVLRRMGVFTVDQLRVRLSDKKTSPVVVTSPLPIVGASQLFWNSDGCVVLQERALLIRTGVDEGLLSPIERDGLWQRHGMPMFEHLLGMDGALLAWECETHSGLHIVEENVEFELVQGELLLTSLTDLVQPTIQMRTGWSAQIETEACDCGRSGKRLTGLRELAPRVTGRKRERLTIAAHG